MKRSIPRDLSPSSRKLFAQLVAEYRIHDLGGRQILRSGLRSLDRAVEAEGAIDKHGLTVTDRWGQLKANPLLATARDFRAQWLSALRALNLSVGDQPTLGRPEGS